VPPARPVGVRALVRLALTGTIFSVICGLGMYWLVKLWPVLPPMGHMLAQRRVDAQMSSRFFADGRAMRLPDAATVARGRMADVMPSAGRAADPLPVTQNVLSLGRHAYEVNCAVCHGAVADGKPLLSAAYGGKPANLQEPKYLAYSDGRIHGIITNGYNIMPSYAYTLDDAQRWQVVLYLRALQRAQHAKDSDLP
jgi:mono/diheme cytochrome c family protein